MTDISDDYAKAIFKVMAGKTPKEKDLPAKLTKNSQPATKAELFKTLFYFFSVYVQVYPKKAASLFNYLVIVHQQTSVLSVPILISLESEMRAKFLANPDWAWTTNHNQITKLLAALHMQELQLQCTKINQVTFKGKTAPKQDRFKASLKDLEVNMTSRKSSANSSARIETGAPAQGALVVSASTVA